LVYSPGTAFSGFRSPAAVAPRHWAQIMQIKEIAREISSRFDRVLVDEYTEWS
jgi:hypothetical protein